MYNLVNSKTYKQFKINYNKFDDHISLLKRHPNKKNIVKKN